MTTTISYPVLRILATIAMVSIVIHYTTSRILQVFHNRGQPEGGVKGGGVNGSYYLRRAGGGGGGIGFLPTTETPNPNARHLVPSSFVVTEEDVDESTMDDLFVKEELAARQRRRRLVPIDDADSTTDRAPVAVPPPPTTMTTTTSCRCTCILAEGEEEEGWAVISFDDELVEGGLGGDPSLCIPKQELGALVETGKGVCDDLCTIN